MSTITYLSAPVTMIRGRSFDETFTWTPPSGAPANLVGSTVSAVFLWSKGLTAAQQLPGVASIVGDGSSNTIGVTLSASATLNIPSSPRLDVIITDPDGVTTHDCIVTLDVVAP